MAKESGVTMQTLKTIGDPEVTGSPEKPTGPAGRPANANSTAPLVRTISSDELLQGGREIHIEHASEVYRLLVTKNK